MSIIPNGVMAYSEWEEVPILFKNKEEKQVVKRWRRKSAFLINRNPLRAGYSCIYFGGYFPLLVE